MKQHFRPTYTWVDVLTASPTEPLPLERRTYQLTRMWSGLAEIERGADPTTDDWRVCSDAVNLLETLVTHGHMTDARGLLDDAVAALAHAGRRHRAGQPIRLDAAGILAVRATLEDYRDAVEALPARTVIQAHRATELRIHKILRGEAQPHDVEVMDL